MVPSRLFFRLSIDVNGDPLSVFPFPFSVSCDCDPFENIDDSADVVGVTTSLLAAGRNGNPVPVSWGWGAIDSGRVVVLGIGLGPCNDADAERDLTDC